MDQIVAGTEATTQFPGPAAVGGLAAISNDCSWTRAS
jgi:hypothetical protein